jgi:hypothetical protein
VCVLVHHYSCPVASLASRADDTCPHHSCLHAFSLIGLCGSICKELGITPEELASKWDGEHLLRFLFLSKTILKRRGCTSCPLYIC